MVIIYNESHIICMYKIRGNMLVIYRLIFVIRFNGSAIALRHRNLEAMIFGRATDLRNV